MLPTLSGLSSVSKAILVDWIMVMGFVYKQIKLIKKRLT
jgi:hypothetical protein